mmetsp:Transcript_21773/g.64871  ORF Transcript_21773/g.64871 Transcript_21773/m.64871 type:complete len:284 (-) Transcript_21773:528-1379(-)
MRCEQRRRVVLVVRHAVEAARLPLETIEGVSELPDAHRLGAHVGDSLDLVHQLLEGPLQCPKHHRGSGQASEIQVPSEVSLGHDGIWQHADQQTHAGQQRLQRDREDEFPIQGPYQFGKILQATGLLKHRPPVEGDWLSVFPNPDHPEAKGSLLGQGSPVHHGEALAENPKGHDIHANRVRKHEHQQMHIDREHHDRLQDDVDQCLCDSDEKAQNNENELPDVLPDALVGIVDLPPHAPKHFQSVVCLGVPDVPSDKLVREKSPPFERQAALQAVTQGRDRHH